MGDSFWMQDGVKVSWDKAALDCESLFRELDTSPLGHKQPLRYDKINEFIFQKEQYPVTDTGSQYLDPAWRRNIIKIKSGTTKIQALISLN